MEWSGLAAHKTLNNSDQSMALIPSAGRRMLKFRASALWVSNSTNSKGAFAFLAPSTTQGNHEEIASNSGQILNESLRKHLKIASGLKWYPCSFYESFILTIRIIVVPDQ